MYKDDLTIARGMNQHSRPVHTALWRECNKQYLPGIQLTLNCGRQDYMREELHTYKEQIGPVRSRFHATPDFWTPGAPKPWDRSVSGSPWCGVKTLVSQGNTGTKILCEPGVPAPTVAEGPLHLRQAELQSLNVLQHRLRHHRSWHRHQ